MIGGVVINGTEPLQVLIRARGPELTDLGVSDALSDPVIELFDERGILIAGNDDWVRPDANEAAIEAIGDDAKPKYVRESAVVIALKPGAYTFHVSGYKNPITGEVATGVGIVELFVL